MAPPEVVSTACLHVHEVSHTGDAVRDCPTLFAPDLRWIKAAAARLSVSAEAYAAALNAGQKLCGGCGAAKPRDDEHFGRDIRRFDGLRSRCRACVSAAKRAHYGRTRPQQRARQLEYQKANREKLYAYNAAWQRTRNAALRAEMLTAYGSACACCGERQPLFLDLDHVENDGAAHRREVGNNTQVMLELRSQGWPRARFQLLCCNCNQGKARNGGVCPHANVQS